MNTRNRKGQFSYADVERRSAAERKAFRAAESQLIATMAAPVIEVHAQTDRRAAEIADLTAKRDAAQARGTTVGAMQARIYQEAIECLTKGRS